MPEILAYLHHIATGSIMTIHIVRNPINNTVMGWYGNVAQGVRCSSITKSFSVSKYSTMNRAYIAAKKWDAKETAIAAFNKAKKNIEMYDAKSPMILANNIRLFFNVKTYEPGLNPHDVLLPSAIIGGDCHGNMCRRGLVSRNYKEAMLEIIGIYIDRANLPPATAELYRGILIDRIPTIEEVNMALTKQANEMGIPYVPVEHSYNP